MNKEALIKKMKKQFRLNCADCKSIIMFSLGSPELASSFKPPRSDDKVDIREIELTLNWGKLKPAMKLADAGLKLAKWQISAYCPPPWDPGIPTILIYQGLMTDLDKALKAVGKKRATSEQSQAIAKAVKKLQTATKQIMTVWQNKASSDITNAIAIAFDGGFDYNDQGSRGPRVSGLFKTTEPAS